VATEKKQDFETFEVFFLDACINAVKPINIHDKQINLFRSIAWVFISTSF